MSKLIADTYVILWKHFEKQSTKDQDFLALATCAAIGYIAILNVAQDTAFIFRIDLGVIYIHTKLGQLIFGAVALMLGGMVMKMFLTRHPDLLTQEGITNRYSRISKTRAITIVSLIFANLVILLVTHQIFSK